MDGIGKLTYLRHKLLNGEIWGKEAAELLGQWMEEHIGVATISQDFLPEVLKDKELLALAKASVKKELLLSARELIDDRSLIKQICLYSLYLIDNKGKSVRALEKQQAQSYNQPET